MTTTADHPVYIIKKASGFCITDANEDRFRVWDGQKTLSVFNWGQLLVALRTNLFDGRKITPMF